MKTHRRLIGCIVFAVAVGVIAGWIASAQEKPRFQKGGIILPGTAISREDEKAMNKILKEYDKSLYRIDTYEKGERKKTRGTLSEIVIGKKLMSEIAERAKKTGFTHYAIRIGTTEGSGHHSPSPGVAEGSGHHSPSPGVAEGSGHHSPSPGVAEGSGHHSPTPGVAEGTGHHSSTRAGTAQAHDTTDSDELVNRLKPILEKYKDKEQ